MQVQKVAVPKAGPRPRAKDLLGPDWQLGWMFAAPAILVIVALTAYPFGQSIVYSFQNVRIGGAEEEGASLFPDQGARRLRSEPGQVTRRPSTRESTVALGRQ